MHSRILPLLLAITHGVAGLAILLIASWFIAACAVAGANFNYVLPAVAIRGLALLRISSGYGEMWLSHHQLLNNLAKLRLRLFKGLENNTENLRATETDKLQYQSQDIASIWVGWIHQNASALCSLLLISGLVFFVLPVFSLIWFTFVSLSLSIYAWLILSSIKQAKLKLFLRSQVESDIEHHIDSAVIWHMKKAYTAPNCEQLYQLEIQNKQKVELANSLLLFVSLGSVVLTLSQMNHLVTQQTITPIYLVLPMALLAAHDWFGRILTTQDRLQDYLNSDSDFSSFVHLTTERFVTSIKTLKLVNFNVANEHNQKLHLSISQPSLTLLTGASGSGKSRVMQAIAGLIDHTGKKMINNANVPSNVPINDISYIEQTPYCLSGTLRQNLLVANEKASDAKIKESLKAVGLVDLSNLDEWLGMGGRQLSGGELKRLGLARALLCKQSIILLDEPFESLDSANIEHIVKALNILKQNKKLIVASHITPNKLCVDVNISLEESIAISAKHQLV